MATKSFFGRESSDTKKGNPLMAGGINPLLGRTTPTPTAPPAAETPAQRRKARQRDKKKERQEDRAAARKARTAPTGTDAIPGYNDAVADAYARGHGGNPTLGPGQYYDPNHGYGTGAGNLQPGAQLRTGVGQILAEGDPRAIFNAHLSKVGLPTNRGASNFGGWLQDEFEGNILPAYQQAQKMGNMDLTFDRFMQGLGGGIANPAPAPGGATTGRPRPGGGQLGNIGRIRPPRPTPVVHKDPPRQGPPQPANPFMRPGLAGPQAPAGPQGPQPGRVGNPFNNPLARNPLAGRSRPGQVPTLGKKPKKPATPKVTKPKGPATGRSGTEALSPTYGTPGQNLALKFRTDFLNLDPIRRGENTGNIFGAGSTAWQAFR